MFDQSYLSINLPYGVTPVSHDIYRLHMLVFIIACFIAFIVFGLLIYSLIRFRKTNHHQPATFTEYKPIEITWTVVPFLILIVLAIPATIILKKIHNTNESGFTVKITGHQWKWEYEYLDYDIRFFSFLSTPYDQIYQHAPKNKWFLLEVDQPMVVPIHTKVKLLIASDDVIHSWWVPSLGVKQDAIPGFINENWIYVEREGDYRGQCGELCGVNHAFMPIVVKAVSENDFVQWMKMQRKKSVQKNTLSQLTPALLLKLGKKAYDNNCAMCHQPNGEGVSFSYPALKGSRVVIAPLDETIHYVLRGVPGAAMQAFGEILDNNTLAEIITYIRHAWGNEAIIQQENFKLIATPQDIQKVRQQYAITEKGTS